MILFFDRSIATVVPKSLKWKELIFPIEIHYHQELFARDEKDGVWLNEVGNWGWTVIGCDCHYHTRPNELSLIKQWDIGCFYMWGANDTKWEKLRCFASAYHRIIELEAFPRPFLYEVDKVAGLKSIPVP